MRGFLVAAPIAVLSLLAAFETIGAPSVTTSADPALARVVDLIHDGRFDEAEEALRRLPAPDREGPAAAFLDAFATWWRLVYDDENPALKKVFEAKLLRAADIASGKQDPERCGGVDPRVWGGYARLLLAQLHASQKKTFPAARDAREGRLLLLAAQQADPGSAEPAFGLGTYSYYADRVSAIVKGLRFLLGLPGGDREEGLELLDLAARRSLYFSLKSRLLLVTIYSGRHERMFATALEQGERALALDPDSIAALNAMARLELSLGKPERAARRLDQALARAAELPGVAASVVAALRLQRARVDFARCRPDRAIQVLSDLERDRALPSRLTRDAAELEALARTLVGASGSKGQVSRELWGKLARALDLEEEKDSATSAQALAKLSQDAPGEPAVEFLLGRALLRAGRATSALARLERADSQGLPEPWRGPCRLLAGQAADLSGQRSEALELYRKALKAPPFIESNAAHLYQKTPFRAGG